MTVTSPESARSVPGAARVAEGIEFLGEYRDSGRTEAPYLLRRSDGRMIEVSPLLYRLAGTLDGGRDLTEIALLISAELGRELTPVHTSDTSSTTSSARSA